MEAIWKVTRGWHKYTHIILSIYLTYKSTTHHHKQKFYFSNLVQFFSFDISNQFFDVFHCFWRKLSHGLKSMRDLKLKSFGRKHFCHESNLQKRNNCCLLYPLHKTAVTSIHPFPHILRLTKLIVWISSFTHLSSIYEHSNFILQVLLS